MNWRVSFLDRYRLTSNSDAHSPGKLGREATTFDCEVDYFAIKHALETGHGYSGTVEFFPDEGKYHLDGHRKCEVRLSPKETLAHGGRCPVCGEPVTIGVEHRVEVLADRSEQEVTPPVTAGEVTNLVPLPEMLSELTGSGPATHAVERSYDQAIAAARSRARDPAGGAGRGHRARRLLAARRGDHAAARRQGDPRSRLRRRIRRHPPVRGERARSG